ncbi:MAG: S-methyl-5'-thioadenosine phosphorylase [Candidatus Buchananbacteria bacterium]|nr:S-methyl-5'-thioadenosine phosphorylase [Candidatus Buchananbacteria bacterium]
MVEQKAQIGVFGGSGFYDLLDNSDELELKTEFGQPSAKIRLGKIAGKKVAFLPRHGDKHTIPPHQVNYKANIEAFKQLGVKQIIAPCAAGSLQPQVKPGDFVILDQFVDRTKGRDDTFFYGPQVAHIGGADPYCPGLAKQAIQACQDLQINVHEQGTVAVVNGPRFSTRAESRWFSAQGWQVINMTQYPEVILAREKEICYCGIALITDFDTGLEGMQDIFPVSLEEVIKVFKQNNIKVKKLIFEIIKNLPNQAECRCRQSLSNALF